MGGGTGQGSADDGISSHYGYFSLDYLARNPPPGRVARAYAHFIADRGLESTFAWRVIAHEAALHDAAPELLHRENVDERVRQYIQKYVLVKSRQAD